MRRIRRILPAALLVIAVVAVTVLWIGSPDQIELPTRHVTASSLSSENLLLSWDAVDYNHRDDTTSPLQHFWSLAVEEQFYLVWPIVIAGIVMLTRMSRLAITQFRRIMLMSISLVTIASFSYASMLDLANPASYFDPFARAWELGVGAAIAVAGTSAALRISAGARRFAAIAAWGVIVGMAFVPGLEGAVPGGGVLPSVIATGIVIICAAPMAEFRFAAVQRTISGLVWLGDRSYSAYLWHWPVLILLPLAIGVELTIILKIVALALVVALSALSFKFIEQPFRTSTMAVIRRPWFLAPISAALTAVLIFGTVAATGNEGQAPEALSAENVLESTTVPLPDKASSRYPLVTPFCNGAGAAVFDCPPTTAVLFGAKALTYFPPASPTCIPLDNNNFF